MDFFDLIQTRKSIRSFSDRKVSAHDVEKIIAAALYAPSNCNQQLWNFIVITDQEIKERLIAEAASNTLLRKAPVLLVLTYDGWSYKEALQGGSLALGHIVLAATSLGIGSLPMNSYGADSQVKRVLNIPSTERICCFVALGYPDERAEKAPRVPRRPVSETIHWNTFTHKNSPPFTYNPEEWSIEQIADHQRYYCRKTFLGKEMDILNEQERQLVRQSVQKVSGPLVDFLTYDGAYIRELPPVASTCVDLISETSEYSREAARLSCGTVDHINFTTFEALGDEKVNTVSIFVQT
jgi:nitroreductase